jgi:hypothetical protein
MSWKLWSIPIRMEGGPTGGGSGVKVRVYDDEALTILSALKVNSAGSVAQQNPLTPNAGKQTQLTVAALAGDAQLTVADVTSFALGDRIRIYDGVNTRKRFITAINAGAKVFTLDSALGVGFAIAGTNVGWQGDRGNVSFWVSDARDYYVEVEDVGSGMRMFELAIPIVAPVAPITVQDEGVAVNTRGTVNFIGPSVTATDDGANGRINVTLTGLQADGTIGAPSIGFASDTDTGFYRVGANDFAAVAAGVKVLEFVGAAGGVNYLEADSAVTGANPSVFARGSDASVSITIMAKGASGSVKIFSDPGNTNGVEVLGAGASTPPKIRSIGGDAHIDLKLEAKGLGGVMLPTHTTDWMYVNGGTGSFQISGFGGSAAIDILLAPKGTGLLKSSGTEVATRSRSAASWSDNTTAIAAGATVSKTATVGARQMCSTVVTRTAGQGVGAFAIGSTATVDAMSFGTSAGVGATSAFSNRNWNTYVGDDGAGAQKFGAGAVELLDFYINGTSLTWVFKNITGVGDTLDARAYGLAWL